MRPSLPITLAAGLLASLAFAPAVSSGAPDLETVPYMVTDAEGDGNAVNGQGLADGEVPTQSTGPAQLAEADILGARITSLYEEVVREDGLVDNVLTGLEFRTALSAEPTAASAPVIHRFIGSTGGCEFWVQASTGTNGTTAHGTPSVRLFDTSCGLEDDGSALGANETVRGDWIQYGWDAEHGEMVVTLDLDHVDVDGRLASRIVRGAWYQLEELHNRGNTGIATVPVIDAMAGPGYAVIGEDIPADETAEGEASGEATEAGGAEGGA